MLDWGKFLFRSIGLCDKFFWKIFCSCESANVMELRKLFRSIPVLAIQEGWGDQSCQKVVTMELANRVM